MIIYKFYKGLRIIRNLFIELMGNPLIVNASLSINKYGKIYHSNWGDDINFFFLEEITDRQVLMLHECIIAKCFKRKNYVIIGSTIDMLVNRGSIIWGAGLITEHPKDLIYPRKICAVRGPKTRNILLAKGFDCPAIYGDPALLLPLYYKPKCQKVYQLGIIPHYSDILYVSENLLREQGVHIIRVQGYKDWYQFIDDINKCECVVSSSLHGLIVAEAYNVPNHWIEFKESCSRERFKYDDFYMSIGKIESPIYVSQETNKDTLILSCQNWKPGKVDLQPLISACPFKLKQINYEKNNHSKYQ